MRDGRSIATRDLELAKELAARLAQQFDPGVFRIILFGSRARGDADEESDLDLFVALERDDPDGEFKAAARRVACDLTLEHGLLISVFVADRAFLQRHKGYSFLETVEEEGVPL